MLVLGYSGHRRHGWGNEASKRSSCLRHFTRHETLFDAITSFGENIEDVPINLFPLDGVGHDAAAAILADGQIVAATAEERFSRFKHSTTIDGQTLVASAAADYCLRASGSQPEQVRHAAYYCDFSPEVFRERVAAFESRLPSSIRSKLLDSYRAVYLETIANDRIEEDFRKHIIPQGSETRLHFVPHHIAHAASAFYSSGFTETGIITFDGSGEKSSSIFVIGGANGLRVLEETMLPTSLGMLYMVMTAFLGFKPLSGEYKVMGLAPYGKPETYRRQFAELIVLGENGSYSTDALCSADFREQVRELFGTPRRERDEVTRREADIAAALQEAFEGAVMHHLFHLKNKYGVESLCMAGGCALNGVLAGKIARSGMFDRVFIFPAAGDDGCSVGAAQYVYYDALNGQRSGTTAMKTAYLGPQFSSEEILNTLEAYRNKVDYQREDHIEARVAEELDSGKIVGWFQGRMEFGPRALGNRSILADPRRPEVKDVVNRCVKYREAFRPFAPAVIEEEAEKFFDLTGVARSPFMLFVVPAKEDVKDKVPAVIHCDGSARLQTVSTQENERFWRLLKAFAERSGLPILLNTSFNVRGEPIVCTPADAVRCFLSTSMDLLAMEDILVWKKESL